MHISVSYDKATQQIVDELMHTLVGGVRQANQEMFNVYGLSYKILSRFCRAFKQIARKSEHNC